jgi:hypothetical protein
MAAPDYAVFSLDLTVVHTDLDPFGPGKVIDAVAVLSIPAGSGVTVRFGAGRPPVPILVQGQAFEICPPMTEGLLFTNPVTAGVAQFLVSFGSIQVQA